MKPVYRLKFDHPDMHGLTLDVTGSTAKETVDAFTDLAVEIGNYASQLAETMSAKVEDMDLPVEPLSEKVN